MSVVKQETKFCIGEIISVAYPGLSHLQWAVKGYQPDRYQPQGGSSFVLIKEPNLIPHLLDTLTEEHQDWISLLQPDWEVEQQSLDRFRLTSHQLPPQTRLTIQDIIPLIHRDHYSPVQIAQELFWTYTCCLNIIGLGRSRIFINFKNPELTGNFVVLVTNRLVSSPKVVLTQWVKFQRSHIDHHSTSAVKDCRIGKLRLALC